jgi:hypothetical protein
MSDQKRIFYETESNQIPVVQKMITIQDFIIKTFKN